MYIVNGFRNFNLQCDAEVAFGIGRIHDSLVPLCVFIHASRSHKIEVKRQISQHNLHTIFTIPTVVDPLWLCAHATPSRCATKTTYINITFDQRTQKHRQPSISVLGCVCVCVVRAFGYIIKIECSRSSISAAYRGCAFNSPSHP
jgi:hypothetical protein